MTDYPNRAVKKLNDMNISWMDVPEPERRKIDKIAEQIHVASGQDEKKYVIQWFQAILKATGNETK